ncbi:tetratricopeptide repeat protein [Streptomyces xanthochromogenes]|uniref:tetratricopeptide repeat protein n=1 Tax=Streptomyces xanthochromogenes TaxID=67384 RepID=UPI0034326543
MTARHLHITGARAADRRAVLDAAGPFAFTTTCHQWLRGPCTALTALLRRQVPEAWQAWPDLVDEHRTALLYLVPELAEHIGPPPPSLVNDTPHEERTRYFAERMIRATSHGVVDFLLAHARRRPGPPLTLAFDDVHAASRTEQEFLALLLRRADPGLLRVAVAAGEGPLLPELAAAIREFTELLVAAPASRPAPVPDARGYVRSDCTGDDPAAYAAYRALPAEVRAALHDERAAELEARPDRGLLIGAIPNHRERGADPRGAGRRALRTALELCVAIGYSQATVDLGMRGRALCDPDTDAEDYCHFTAKAASALVPLGRYEECVTLYRELRRRYPTPRVQMSTSYALAVLHTRFLEPRDHDLALEHMNNARALAALEPDPVLGAYYQVFQDNGLALVAMHRGDLELSHELTTRGIARLERELPSDRYVVHRSQLLHNRARVRSALGRLEEAHADFTELIARDPHYVEYHMDRADVRRGLGDLAGALAGYDRAVEVSVPMPELFHNRGGVRAEAGDVEGALADFARALDLEPAEPAPRLARAALLIEADRPREALAELRAGLALHGEDARLLCLAGLAEQALGEPESARAAYDRALAADPSNVPALTDRAVLTFEQGDPLGAVADLTAALALGGEDPDVLYNRGFALAAAGEPAQALADFSRALALPGADLAGLLCRRAECLARLGESRRAAGDLHDLLRLHGAGLLPDAEPAEALGLLDGLAAGVGGGRDDGGC